MKIQTQSQLTPDGCGKKPTIIDDVPDDRRFSVVADIIAQGIIVDQTSAKISVAAGATDRNFRGQPIRARIVIILKIRLVAGGLNSERKFVVSVWGKKSLNEYSKLTLGAELRKCQMEAERNVLMVEKPKGMLGREVWNWSSAIIHRFCNLHVKGFEESRF